MVDGEEYRRWRAEADQALKVARAAARESAFNWACFGCEQAAQLGVKALLHGLGAGPWGHDLPLLGERLVQTGVAVSEAIGAALQRLSRHYIPARYPDAHAEGTAAAHYGFTDWEEAFTDTQEVLAFVDETWRSL